MPAASARIAILPPLARFQLCVRRVAETIGKCNMGAAVFGCHTPIL